MLMIMRISPWLMHMECESISAHLSATSKYATDTLTSVMGSSHTEPMMRATNEWTTFGNGAWEWDTNNASIYPYVESDLRKLVYCSF